MRTIIRYDLDRLGARLALTQALRRGSGVRAAAARILEDLDLKVDREGNRRTAYSLRHTYVSTRLMEGADMYRVAKNCRTSVEMIEKYYASHIKNMIDASAINVRRSAPSLKTKSATRKPRNLNS